MVERWRQLPLDHALRYAGRVRALIQSLADAVAGANGIAASVVPDCGPATLMDQLTVLVHDASAAGVTSTPMASTAVTTAAVTTAEGTTTLAQDLASLRRELR